MAWWSRNASRSTGDTAHLEAVRPLAALNAAGAARLQADRPDLAVDLFTDALAGCREKLGSAHPDTLTVAGNLGVALVQAGRWQEGLDVLEGNHAARVRATTTPARSPPVTPLPRRIAWPDGRRTRWTSRAPSPPSAASCSARAIPTP